MAPWFGAVAMYEYDVEVFSAYTMNEVRWVCGQCMVGRKEWGEGGTREEHHSWIMTGIIKYLKQRLDKMWWSDSR